MRILVMHCTEKGRLPELTVEQGKKLKSELERLLSENPEVKYNGTFISSDGVGFCDWEASSVEVVGNIVKALGAPYDVIVSVEQLEL